MKKKRKKRRDKTPRRKATRTAIAVGGEVVTKGYKDGDPVICLPEGLYKDLLIGFDEMTHFTEKQIVDIISRNRH